MLLVLQNQINFERKTSFITNAETFNDSISALKNFFMISTSKKFVETNDTSQSIETVLIFRKFMFVTLINEPISLVISSFFNDFVSAHASSAIISKKNKSIVIEINFKLYENLIYHVKNDVFKLCISNNCQKNVFKIAHDDNFHVEQNKVYRQLTKTMYISFFFQKTSTLFTSLFEVST